MKIFFLVHLKNFSNTTRRAFLTAFQFSLLDLYLFIYLFIHLFIYLHKIVIIYT